MITRLEIIDRSKSYEDGGGRIYTKYDIKDCWVDIQNDGKTIKVFINESKLIKEMPNKKEEEKVEVGDIYTNGINYWMVTFIPSKTCDNPSHNIFNEPVLVPIIMKRDGTPDYIETYPAKTTISNIKPVAVYYGKMKFTPTTKLTN